MVKKLQKGKKFHSGIVKKTIRINVPEAKVWKKVSNIVGLPEWLIDVRKTVYLSKKKRGIGAIRNITFEDGNQIEEHIVAWENKTYFSYLAVTGLPLRVYHATISVKGNSKNKTSVTWKTYLNSKKMSRTEFKEFVTFLEDFYQKSLQNLKSILEK